MFFCHVAVRALGLTSVDRARFLRPSDGSLGLLWRSRAPPAWAPWGEGGMNGHFVASAPKTAS